MTGLSRVRSRRIPLDIITISRYSNCGVVRESDMVSDVIINGGYMPRRARCKGVTQYGKQCQYHAEKDGLCPVHYRMAHGKKGRNQPKSTEKGNTVPVNGTVANPSLVAWLLNDATPKEFEQFVELRKLPAMLPLLKVS